MKQRIIKKNITLCFLTAAALNLLRNQTTHTGEKPKERGFWAWALCVREKHSTARLRVHRPEMKAFIGELSPETMKATLYLSSRDRYAEIKLLGFTPHGCFGGFPIHLRKMKWQTWTQTPRMEQSWENYWCVPSLVWCVNTDLRPASREKWSLGYK